MSISPVTRSKTEARATYDRISGWYDLLAGNWEDRPREAGLQKLGAREGESVLEIGFGTGHAILALARSVGNSGRVYGLDLSPGMSHVTRTRVSKLGLMHSVALACGDAVRLPFEAERFDALFMSFTLELLDTPEIPAALYECRRVLRRGGRACIISLSRVGGLSWMTALYEWGHRRWPQFLDCRPIFVQQAVEGAGFQVVDATRVGLWGLSVEIVLAGKPSLPSR